MPLDHIGDLTRAVDDLKPTSALLQKPKPLGNLPTPIGPGEGRFPFFFRFFSAVRAYQYLLPQIFQSFNPSHALEYFQPPLIVDGDGIFPALFNIFQRFPDQLNFVANIVQ